MLDNKFYIKYFSRRIQKKKLSYYCTFLFLLSGITLSAQQFPVTGKIIDGEIGFPLEFSTVSELHAADSTLVNGAAADLNGEFELIASPGHLPFSF